MHRAAHAARQAVRLAENLRDQPEEIPAQRKQVRMGAMAAEDPVAAIERRRGADRDRFLADREVTRRFRQALLHERTDRLFREADRQHVRQEFPQRRRIDAPDIESVPGATTDPRDRRGPT